MMEEPSDSHTQKSNKEIHLSSILKKIKYLAGLRTSLANLFTFLEVTTSEESVH